MSAFESIDEDYGDNDESLDDASLDDDLAERRRRRRHHQNVKGRGYVQPRSDQSPVNQTQMQAALARVAADVRKLAAGQKVLEEQVAGSVKKLRGDTQQSLQMAALLPMLFKPKSKTLAELAASGEATTAKFMIDSNDSLSMMLPLLLMGGMGGGTASGTGGDNNMVMMFALMMAMDRK